MDINSAEKYIVKLLAYVKDLADTKPKMYQKSRGKLKDLAETCKEVVTLISEILQDESLNDDDMEFGSRSNIASALDSMQEQITQIRNFAGVPSSIPNASDTIVATNTSNSKKQVIRNYRDAMQHIALVDFVHDPVLRCAKLLGYWFDTRFTKTVNSGFKYSMKRFPIWVRDIVILYGRAIRDNEYISFDTKFRTWIDSLPDTSNAQKQYAVPYEVFEFERSMKPSDMSLEAVVLWDILVDNGLSEICTRSTDDMYLSEDAVYNLCSELNPSVLDGYANYVEHPDIFVKLGWEVCNA